MASGGRARRSVQDFKWGLIVTSDSVLRGEKRDEITPLVEKILGEHGFTLAYKVVTGNNMLDIQYHVLSAIKAGAELVLVTGGTGPSAKDVSIEAVEKLATKEMPGIGELFRRVSYDTVGDYAYISRSSGYIVHGALVVVTPGNPNAVEVMLEKVLLNIAGHIVAELRRYKEERR
ncbi:MAG: molybdopterin-binding protein [Pyrodictiaceae archaeon]